jgi:hypothetical protein
MSRKRSRYEAALVELDVDEEEESSEDEGSGDEDDDQEAAATAADAATAQQKKLQLALTEGKGLVCHVSVCLGIHMTHLLSMLMQHVQCSWRAGQGGGDARGWGRGGGVG